MYFRNELVQEVFISDRIMIIAEEIKPKKIIDKHQKLKSLMEKERKKFPNHFSLAIDQRVQVSDLILEKCKVLDSKKLPLWLVMKNSEANGYNAITIFKTGDDLVIDFPFYS